MKLSLAQVAITSAIGLTAASTATAIEPDASAPALNILFIGNSYTGTENVPNRVKQLATSAGWATPYIESVSPGSAQLWEHANGTASNAPTRILNGPGGTGLKDWDIVVLQEQSQLPANPTDKTWFYSGALSLYNQIQQYNPNAQVVLYETWARHSSYNFAGASYYIGDDAQDMQDRLSESYNYVADTYIPTYSNAADKTDVRVAEVGEAWRASYLDDPNFLLHQTDKSHPTSEGVYLSALMLYSEIYFSGVNGLSNAGLTNVSLEEAARLQSIASLIIPDAYTRKAGDANGDSKVNGTDLAILAERFGKTVPRMSTGDFNGDGLVNGIDLALLSQNFGYSASSPEAIIGIDYDEAYNMMFAVPEPASAITLAIGGLIISRRRR